MKSKLYLSTFLAAFIIFTGLTQHCYAAFAVQHIEEESSLSRIKGEKVTFPVFKNTGVTENTKKSEPGYGIASFACGVVAYISIIAVVLSGSIGAFAFAGALAIAAIVLGAIGFNKKLKGLAIAGFVIGVLMIFPVALALIASAFYK